LGGFQEKSSALISCHCPAEFSSKPNQTHLSKLINVFRITIMLKVRQVYISARAKLSRTSLRGEPGGLDWTWRNDL